jgi:LPXTG-motif cell wall-anchored protein
MTPRHSALALLACAFLVTSAAAQAPDAQVPVYKLDLRKVPDIPEGDAALVAGNAGSTPDRFYLDALYMLKPVSVTVRAVNPGDVVNVRITKDEWNKVLREASTGNENQVNFKFRTHGEFQVSITSPQPNTPYKMVVWVGPDIAIKPSKSVFAPNSQFDTGSKNWMWWALGGAGAVILVLVGMLLGRRKAS